MRKTAFIMGMPVSIDVPGLNDGRLIAACFDLLREIDNQFSTYKPSSEISRLRSGEIKTSAASKNVADVLDECVRYQKITHGAFSAHYDGRLDPSGYVKGWAIQKTAEYLRKHLLETFLINIAGDVLASSSTDQVWSIGLQNPFKPNKTVGTVSAKNMAIATSGIAARGAHIYDPSTNKPVKHIVSATVIGPDIISADVFATACCVWTPPQSIEFIDKQSDFEVLIIEADGSVHMSSCFSKMQTVR